MLHSLRCSPLRSTDLRDGTGSRLGTASCRAGFSLVEPNRLSYANAVSLANHSPRHRPGSAGFTLVELSIVLVILGLLTGGILTGQNLIRAAELRSVTTEFQAYQTAVMTFRDRYFALPGDMRNATDFWGAMTNCGVASPSGTGTQTCNGNGNGLIEGAASASQTGEVFGFWQHLENAGLLEGSYTGIAGVAHARDHEPQINAPAGKLGNSLWGVRHLTKTFSSLPHSGNYFRLCLHLS